MRYAKKQQQIKKEDLENKKQAFKEGTMDNTAKINPSPKTTRAKSFSTDQKEKKAPAR